MPILTVILILALIGLLTWAALRWVPMPESFKPFFVGIIMVLVAVWILTMLNLLPIGAGPVVHPVR